MQIAATAGMFYGTIPEMQAHLNRAAFARKRISLVVALAVFMGIVSAVDEGCAIPRQTRLQHPHILTQPSSAQR